MHISVLIDATVANDCSCPGIYCVLPSAAPIPSAVRAAVNFTIRVWSENTTPSFLVPSLNSP